MALQPGASVFSNPRGHDYQRLTSYRTWIQCPVPPLPPVGPVGAEFTELPPRPYYPGRTWTWSYNLNLIGKDELFLRHVYGAPDPLRWYQNWSQNLLQTTLSVVQRPFNQYIWPNPREHQRNPTNWIWEYNRNLIANDDIGIRHRWGIPGGHQWQKNRSYREWTSSLNTTTLSAFLPFNQEDWPNPRGHRRGPPSWTASYLLTLVGQDKLPVGSEITELPPRPHYPGRTWTWNYNLNLIANDDIGIRHRWGIPAGHQWRKDRSYREWTNSLNTTTLGAVLPAGKIVHERPPRGALQPDRFWAWSYNLNLVGRDIVPGQRHFERVPRDYQRSPPSWAWWYNLNLVGQDRLPTGEIFSERPAPVSWYRDWSQNLQQSTFSVTLRPFSQLDWPLPKRAVPSAAPTWTWNYNLNLIEQDALYIRQVYKLPAGHFVREYRNWSQSLLQSTLSVVAPLPFNQYQWPLPIRAKSSSAPSWMWWYNLNLIGQDELFLRHDYGSADRPTWYRNWSQNLLQATLSPVLVQPFKQLDWPLPKDYRRGPPSWANWYNLNLIGQDVVPGKRHVELVPRDYQRSPPSWLWWYNLNLTGQDRLPAGEIFSDRPPPVTWYRDWSQNLQQSTLSIVFRPFNQFDWPLPRDFKRVTPSWTAFYNVNLIGQDRLPTGTIIYEIAPRDYKRSPPSWAWWYNLNLIAQDAFPAGKRHVDRPPPVTWYRDWSQSLTTSTLSVIFYPFNQFDWPLPIRAKQPASPSWTWSYNLNLVAQDSFPSGDIVYERTPPDIRLPHDSFWAWTFNPNLFPPVIPPPRRGGVKVFPPRRYEPREIDKRRTFSRKYYAELLAAERAQNAAETRALQIANEEKRSAAMAALDASAEAIEKAAMDAAAEQELRKLTSSLEAAARAKKVVTVLEHARHAEVIAAALEAHLRRVEEEDEEEAIMLLLH